MSETVKEKAHACIRHHFTQPHLHRTAAAYVDHRLKQTSVFAEMTAIHYELFRAKQTESEKNQLVAVVELLLLALDIMDDLQDGDGFSQPWGQAGLAETLNIITGLLLACLAEVNKLPAGEKARNAAMSVVQTSILRAINGQADDVANDLQNEEQYIAMVLKKSGSLLQLACLLGAGAVNEPICNTIKAYAGHFGVLEQIRNDASDIKKPDEKNDIRRRKKTLPVLFCLNSGPGKYQAVKNYYSSCQPYEDLTAQEKTELQSLLCQGGALSYCAAMEQLYILKLRKCLNELPVNELQKKKLQDKLS